MNDFRINDQNMIFEELFSSHRDILKLKTTLLGCAKIKVNAISQFNSYRTFSLPILTYPTRQLKYL